jgi:hypothetical protein
MDEEINENDPHLDFNNTFVVTGLPIITPDKCEKYFTMLVNKRISIPIHMDEVYMPFDETNHSKGYHYCFYIFY